MRITRLRRVLVVLALAIGVIAPVASAAAAFGADGGGVGIRLVDAPVNRRDDPRARTYIVDHLAPGARIARRVEVSNQSDEAVVVNVYAGSAKIADNAFTFGDGAAPNDLTGWTSIGPATLNLPPKGRATATVTIAVPSDASVGERYGVIWAERPPSPGTGVHEGARVGVRMYLSIGEGGEPASDFAIDSLQAQRLPDGRPGVSAMVRNTGGRALDVRGELALNDGPGGLSAGPFAANPGTTIGVGASTPVVVPLDSAIPLGPWQARLTLKAGLLERSAEARLAFPAEGSAPPVAPTQSGGFPWVVAAAVAIIAAALAVLQMARRRRRSHIASGR